MPEDPGPLTREAGMECYAQCDEHIGQGGRGTVYRYIHHPTGTIHVAKVLYCDNEDGATDNERRIVREQIVAPHFVHAFICPYPPWKELR